MPDSMKGAGAMEGNDREMIEEIMRHLDAESQHGVYRMSITFDEESEEAKNISHECCNMYVDNL